MDLELQDIECLWIELSLNRRKIPIGTFYRPPNSPVSALASTEKAVGFAYDTNISDILIVGDFDLDMQKPVPGRKVDNLCQQFNLHNLIQDKKISNDQELIQSDPTSK